MINKILDFLDSIMRNGGSYLIEAEAKQKTMETFIKEYNDAFTPPITLQSEGIICLHNNADKWGLELRLYVPIAPPIALAKLFCKNRAYKTEYLYRLNDNRIIEELFKNGCRIGIN